MFKIFKVCLNSFDLKRNLVFLFLLIVISVNAQVSLRIEPGVLLKTESDNIGLIINIEPNIKVEENLNLGLRFGIATNPQSVTIDETTSFFINELDDNGILSFVPTLDYYLNNKKLKPYLGLGIGYYLFNDVDISDRNSGVADVLNGRVKNQLGLLLRGGLEIRRMRYGLEYNFMPKADIKIPDGQTIGTINNSYFGVSFGFRIG